MNAIPSYRLTSSADASKTVEVSPGLILAPMSGVTCRPFRRLIKEINGPTVGLTVTEFISVEALTRKVNRSIALMRKGEEEIPFSIQIFGYDISRMRDAAKMAEDAGADIVDINCGCPAPKVVRKGGGCELMRQPEHLGKVLSAVRAAIKVPLTLKMRSGWDSSCINAVQIAKVAEAAGVDGLAVHGRTKAQMYRGESDWNVIGEVAAAVKVPVLGSGDVTSHKTAMDRFALSGAAGALIGRGALTNPLVFKEICSGDAMKPLEWKRNERFVLSILRRYSQLLHEDFQEKIIPGRIKQLASQMCRGFAWRKEILVTQSQADLDALLLRKFEAASESLPEYVEPSIAEKAAPETLADDAAEAAQLSA